MHRSATMIAALTIAGCTALVVANAQSFPGVHFGMPVAIRKAEFDFLQLSGWYTAFMQHGIPKGTVFSGIDKSRNRLLVGVVDAAAEARMRSYLTSLGIPREAVAIERAQYPRPLGTDTSQQQVLRYAQDDKHHHKSPTVIAHLRAREPAPPPPIASAV
jgi:hypothetical protein